MLSNNEHVDMLLILRECRNSVTAAARTYADRYPGRQHASKNVFRRLEQRARETGRFLPLGINRERPRSTRTPEVEEAILNLVEENLKLSARNIPQ
ncbi:hypothetical protein Zmor_014502 [Zophobas morio]|uniref:DUF4817 domain-containing protein n=1 Tax=Zophobas morio TaxID=2755281 RepID=A0AA38IHV1_9CUCU|nr:hypothetical protein Zmor_014502 [Zophobas morio]